MQSDTAEFIFLLKQRDKTALLQLYKQYGPALYHCILKMIPSEETACSVLQRTFDQICRSLPHYNPGKQRLFTWMVQIALRQCATEKQLSSTCILSQLAPAKPNRLQLQNSGNTDNLRGVK